MNCPSCNEKIEDDSKYCPKCGADIGKLLKKENDNIRIVTTMIVFVVFILLLFFVGFISSVEQESSTTNDYTDMSQPTVQEAVYKPDLEVLNSKMEYCEWGKSVKGTVINNSSETKSLVQIFINLYDSQGNQVGDTYDNISNLAPNTKWKFEAPILEDNVSRYEITEVR